MGVADLKIGKVFVVRAREGRGKHILNRTTSPNPCIKIYPPENLWLWILWTYTPLARSARNPAKSMVFFSYC